MAATIAVGISLGSESATLAVTPATIRDANGIITSSTVTRPTIIAAEDGERSTPAFAAIVDSAVLTGAPAKNAAMRHPKNSVSSLAPLLSKAKGFDALVAAKVDFSGEDAMLTAFEETEDGSKPHSVKSMLVALLSHLATLAEGAAGGKPISSVVISVPRYVDADLVQAALKKVEFPEAKCLEVIYDDCAAMLANGMGGPTWAPKLHHHGVLVVDAGATATQVSVLTCKGGVMTLLASDFITTVSGKKIDAALAKGLIASFKRKERCDPGEAEGRPYRKLLIAAEMAKKTLTSSATANANVEAFFEGHDIKDQVSRGQLATALGAEVNFFKQLDELTKKVLTAATEADDSIAISHIVLHGGVMRIPAVQNAMKQKCLDAIESVIDNDDQLDMLDDDLVEVVDAVPGDEAACIGAALQASLIANGHDQVHGTTHGVPALVGQMHREALTFDIGFWGHSEAPKVDDEGKLELPEAEEKGDDEPTQNEQHFTMIIQKGSPLPMEINIEVATETTMLLVGRTGYEEYLPLANSITIPKVDEQELQTLHLVIKLNGELTVTPVVTGETFATVDPLVLAKIF